MAKIRERDPLLAFARVVIATFGGMFAFAAAVVTIGLGAAVIVERGDILVKLAAAGVPGSKYESVIMALFLVIVLMTLGVLFMRELFRIVGSVEEGDPFQPFNADRLRRMGWITVTGQLVLFALAAIAISIGGFRQALVAEDAMTAGSGALLLVITLFVLARVFRVGADMRNELEGTV